jgi:hypothetical protein
MATGISTLLTCERCHRDESSVPTSDPLPSHTCSTPNIIAMGLPASGLNVGWRNRIDDVAAMLRHYHRDRFMILNLTMHSYDCGKFDHNVRHIGWPDHHAPPLRLLLKCTHEIAQWLVRGERHVVAVHCKAGRGRTGVIVVCASEWRFFLPAPYPPRVCPPIQQPACPLAHLLTNPLSPPTQFPHPLARWPAASRSAPGRPLRRGRNHRPRGRRFGSAGLLRGQGRGPDPPLAAPLCPVLRRSPPPRPPTPHRRPS